MIRRAVVYAPEAERDLLELYDHLAGIASPTVAIAYLRRVQTWLDGLDLASERGTLHDDIRPGLRTIGFERRITIAFTVETARVVILRAFYGGQDWAAALTAEDRE